MPWLPDIEQPIALTLNLAHRPEWKTSTLDESRIQKLAGGALMGDLLPVRVVVGTLLASYVRASSVRGPGLPGRNVSWRFSSQTFRSSRSCGSFLHPVVGAPSREQGSPTPWWELLLGEEGS